MKKNIKILSCLTLLSLSAFADEGKAPTMPFEQGTELNISQAMPAYNYPARVKTSDSWDTFVTASLLYWDVFQEGMELGQLEGNGVFASGILEFSDEYKGGFQVGLGWNTPFDDWTLSLDYMRFHHSLHKSQPAGQLLTASFVPLTFNSSFHKWTIDLDMVDVMMSRPCYQGIRFILTPSFGLRGVFLNQKYKLTGVVNATDTPSFNPTLDYGKTDSWAVGPAAGLEGRLLLGEGFRLEGSVLGTLTFTRYNGIQIFGQTIQAGIADTNTRGSDENRVRAIADAQAGFGWGMYLYNQKCHIDFSAMYEFQVFWNQNMVFWYTNSLNVNKIGTPPGNLYFQGFTVKGTFDF